MRIRKYSRRDSKMRADGGDTSFGGGNTAENNDTDRRRRLVPMKDMW